MDDRQPSFRETVAPDDVTLDAADMSSLETSSAPLPHVHLVGDSAGGISTETDLILRARLRVAALVLFAGFLVFLVWDVLIPGSGNPLERWLF